MKIKIIITVFITFTVSTIGGYLVYKNINTQDITTVNSSESKLKNPSAYTTPIVKQPDEISQLKVKGLNAKNDPVEKNVLLDPSQFKIYEKNNSDSSPSYIEVKAGTGEEAANGRNLAMLYKGYLTDGTVFDESRVNEDKKYEAFSFKLGAGQVIRGWDLGIAGMRVGGTRRLIIPSQFGYGANGQGSIPPNALLIFDVQLVEVQ